MKDKTLPVVPCTLSRIKINGPREISRGSRITGRSDMGVFLAVVLGLFIVSAGFMVALQGGTEMKWSSFLLATAALLWVVSVFFIFTFWDYVSVQVVIIAMTGFIVKALEDIRDTLRARDAVGAESRRL